MKNKIIKAFFATFLGLALTAAILYFGFDISLETWYWRLLIALIMFGVPVYVYFKNKK